ncbi:MAG: zinc-binding dehydrogenase [Balneolaceae bacterium]
MKTERIQESTESVRIKKDAMSMRTAVLVAPEQFEMQTKALPEPADDEIRIRIEGCGLCASNLPSWEGREWFSYPMEPGSPGHEAWGTADAVGKNVHHINRGDRITGLSYHAYAEYDIAGADHVVKLPPSLNGRPFPGEPLGCAMNIFRRSRIEAGMTVAVVGTGFLGLLLVQLAKDAGARVIAISKRTSSLKMAEQFGADHVMQATEHGKVLNQVAELTRGDLCECVLEVTGKQKPLNLAAGLTGVKGRLIIAGYHQDGRRDVDMQLWNWRGMDVINAHERDPMVYRDGIEQAVKAVEEGVIDPFPLFTSTFPGEEIQQAFRMHQQKPDGFIKALINFT